jgi:hypothetical protein
MRVLSAPRLFLAYRLPPIPVTAFDVRQHCVWLVCGGDPTLIRRVRPPPPQLHSGPYDIELKFSPASIARRTASPGGQSTR